MSLAQGVARARRAKETVGLPVLPPLQRGVGGTGSPRARSPAPGEGRLRA